MNISRRGFLRRSSGVIATGSLAATSIATTTRSALAQEPDVGLPLRVSVHVQGVGKVTGRNAEWVGTKGQGRSISAFGVEFVEPVPDLGIRYKFHVGNRGDLDWVTGYVNYGDYMIQGVSIELTGAAASKYTVLYQAHIGFQGDTEIFRDGYFCGTRGLGRDLQAVIVVVKKK